ncbi:MAG: aldehyde dehydrogenase family protein [Paracoccaceae bacterium]
MTHDRAVHPLIVGGERATTGEVVENLNPSDLPDVVGRYALAGRAEAQAAIRSAREAQPAWGRSTAETRHDVLVRASAEVMSRSGELGRLLAREEGKTLAEATAEVVRAARLLDFFAGEALRAGGERPPSVRPGVDVEVLREPVGVVGVITPWNYPIAIPAWKIAPALAFGNAVVFKPAELVPASAWALADILARAGLPPGVLNLVPGAGRVVGREILESEAVDAVTFTGSEATGRLVAEACARHMRRVQLEMGGSNPLVVLDDADLDCAVAIAADGAFGSTGQRCTASRRLIVTEGIHARFVEALVERVRALRVGHALYPSTEIGPVASEAQLAEDLDWIARTRDQGGVLRAGGERVRRETEGYFLAPALFTDTHADMEINRREVFGPLASVIRVRDYEEALATANATPYGLSAGICTTSLRHARDFRDRAEAGMVMVNLATAGVDYHVPFGGRKRSSLGPREQGAEARDFFTTVKTAYVAG